MENKVRENKMEDINREEQAKKIVEEMNKDINLAMIEEMIKDNNIKFTFDGKEYRVRLLNNMEKEELNILRVKKFNSMLQEKDDKGNYVYLTEKNLIDILKIRGDIDIDKLNEDIKKLDTEEKNLQLNLGEALSKDEPISILENYRNQINEIEIKKSIINTQKTLLLKFSLESQLLDYIARLITYLSSDIFVDGEWNRLFNNLDDFENFKNDKLKERLAIYSMLLQYK